LIFAKTKYARFVCSFIKRPILAYYLKKIGSAIEPIFVEVASEDGMAINDCFNNVNRKIKANGGVKICGRQIIKSHIVMEGEAHAVWKSTEGELFDITSKINALWKEILYIPDNSY
jgi:copper chaperone CopZ